MTKQCPECDNEYLTIRTDFYKDKREFVYCDCCGFILQEKSWHLVYSAKEAENIRKTNLHCVDMFNMLKADYDKLREAAASLLEANSYYFPEGNPWGDRLKAVLKE